MEHESKVQCTREMFRYAESFNQPLARGICVAVKICLGMVLYMSDFHQPLSCRNVSNVVDMGDMFYTASGLLEPACLDQWDARRVENTGLLVYTHAVIQPADGDLEHSQCDDDVDDVRWRHRVHPTAGTVERQSSRVHEFHVSLHGNVQSAVARVGYTGCD